MKNLIVQLRLYKGEVHHDENRNVTSENQLMKLHYGIREWTLFLNNILQMGWTKVDVVKCLDETKKTLVDGVYQLEEVDIPKTVIEEVQKAMAVNEKPLTEEQREIKELKAMVAELAGKKPAKKEKAAPKKEAVKDNTPNINEELETARDEYLKVIGKKPHHMKQLTALNKEIKEKLAK